MPSTISDRLSRAVRPGYGMKSPVVAASTGNLTLYGSSQTLDGVACSTGRVLVWQQNNAYENGIYDVSGSTWARAKDFDGSGDILRGTFVPIRAGGTAYGNLWAQVTSTGQNFNGEHSIGDSTAFDSVSFTMHEPSLAVTLAASRLLGRGSGSSGSAQAITVDGSLSISGTTLGLTVPVSIDRGGTSSTSAANARTALGVPGTPVTIADGGTSSTSASAARTALAVAYEESSVILAHQVFL